MVFILLRRRKRKEDEDVVIFPSAMEGAAPM